MTLSQCNISQLLHCFWQFATCSSQLRFHLLQCVYPKIAILWESLLQEKFKLLFIIPNFSPNVTLHNCYIVSDNWNIFLNYDFISKTAILWDSHIYEKQVCNYEKKNCYLKLLLFLTMWHLSCEFVSWTNWLPKYCIFFFFLIFCLQEKL